ncbi:electron transfer flavo protein subunit alpha, mitochondrial precursor [Sphaerosporella brunnea]|uniref:Probable electron transfer flavoprotein subunit alpha n=1 Tax=Sphaerosporella brunnea TaxID=1250544 RepID=A0A5J5F3G5_9PEZI|nr:electron transfer flavo protein subunit alpha, mitochondrial precursor [Sphaerosporella brunnea]
MFALRNASRRLYTSRRSRLLSTLAVLEHRGGQVSASSLPAVTAASKLGGPVTAFIAGGDSASVAAQAAKLVGVSKVLHVPNGAYDKGLPENFAPLLAENIKAGGFTHVVCAHSAFGKNIMPRVAALLDIQPISDVTEIKDATTFVRPIYAGNAIATVKTGQPTNIITVRGTAFPASATEGGNAEVAEAPVDPKAPALVEWVEENLAKSERPDLATASKVVSGGRGLKNKVKFDEFMPPLADALGAAIGASRAAVDAGFADNSLQVGQTGKVVAPQLYMAVGISGAIQHLAGMKDSKVIAAINKDADAPIFQVADVGLVADLFQAVPELTEKLKNEK